MASPNSSYGELLSTTLQLLEPKLMDNISNHNALLDEAKKRKMYRSFDGGPKIVEPIIYQENATYKRYSGAEQLDISPSESFTAAEFAIKQIALSVGANGLEILQNSGKSRMFDLMESRLKVARITFENNFTTDLYSDGTASGGKQVGGLQLLLSTDPTAGIVGGISRVTWSFWRHQIYKALTTGGATKTASNIQTYMRRLWMLCDNGKFKPTLIVADNNDFILYEESLTSIQRLSSDDVGRSGYQKYKFKTADVVYDGGLGGNCPANTMFFICGDHLGIRYHKDRNFKMLNPDRYATNQDAVVKLMAWAGNATINCSRNSGILTNT